MKRKWLGRVLWTGAAVVGLCVAGVACLVAWEWTYVRRMSAYPDNPITNVAWYTPQEVVRGQPGDQLPVASNPSVKPEALAAAAAYAEAKNSSAFLVLHRGEIVAEHYWRGHGRDARTNSMSMAKTVVGLLVGIAIDEGRIASVDAPASKYLTEWANDGRRDITIRHLLQMRSGLRCGEDYSDPFSNVGYMYLGTDSLYVVAGTPLEHQPGTRYAYDSVNTQALSLILERATGRRYADYLSEKLWQPLGARDAAVWLDKPGGHAKSFCCLFATARDWGRLGLLVQNKGKVGERQVVPEAWVAQMTTPSPVEPDYGYQVWLCNNGTRTEDWDDPSLVGNVVYFDGMMDQRVYVVPSRQLVVVRLGENAKGWDDDEMLNAVLKGLPPGAGGEPGPEKAGTVHRSPITPSASSHQPRTKVAA